MSISPPSDIILDVTRAADPVRAREAAARLDAPGSADATFATTLAAQQPSTPSKESTPAPNAARAASNAGPAAGPSAYRDFEAMILANFFESAMPHDEALFGAGTSGSVWTSVFVQEIAKSVAAKGGIGIAETLAHNGGLTPLPALQSGDADVTRLLLARLADASTDGLWGSE